MSESQKKRSRKIINLSILPILLALLIGIFASEAKAVSITTAEITDCTDGERGFSCKEGKKTLITLAVSYGLEHDIEVTTVSYFDADGEPVAAAETLEFTISKSMPVESYPLRHFHTVAYFPYEEVIKVPDTLGCIDCADSCSPTAGWTYQDANQIPYSQGFCISKLLDPFYNDCFWRGEKTLGTKATWDNPFSTAHALRMGELYYHGYEIGKRVRDFEISITLKQGDANQELWLTPNNPVTSTNVINEGVPQYPDPAFHVVAELVGDMKDYKAAPDLSNYILYIPAGPNTHPYVQNYWENMLLVPREEVSKDDTELDKVGVSYYAFRKLIGSGNARVTQAGDGLHNQLYHKHGKDLQTLIKNPDAETEYLISGKKIFKNSMEFKAGMNKVLEHKIPYISYSEISLMLYSLGIAVVTSESMGIIVEAHVEDFDSMSEDGVLVVLIQNEGSRKANYIVTVTDVNQNILGAIPAQARSLEEDEQERLYFDISTLKNLDTSNEVLVSIKSPKCNVYDSVVVKFDTRKHASKYSWELQQKNEGSQEGTPQATAPNDVTAPVITLNSPDDTMVLAVGDDYNEPNAVATDNSDPNVIVVIGGDVVDTSVAGTYVVTYDANDISGNAAKQLTRTVIVREAVNQDTTAPQLLLSATPTTLWPANHKMVKVTVTMIATDDPNPSPVVSLLGVTLSEGDLANDVEIHNDGLIYLRAETLSSETSREYTITYRATDASSNSTDESVTITVPHDASAL
jgi:hypothetical protein